MISIRPWLLSMLASVGAVGGLLWSWGALHPAPSGTLEVTFRSEGAVWVKSTINFGVRKMRSEKIGVKAGGFSLDQTVTLDVYSPEVRRLSVVVSGRGKGGQSLRSARLLGASGTVLWVSPDLAGDWSLEKPVPLNLKRGMGNAPAWLAWIVGGLATVLATRMAWRVSTILRRSFLPPSAFAGVVLLGFAAAGGLYLAAIESQRGAPLPSESWTHDLFLEKAALAHEFPSPRTLLVGGSSGLYGVDTAWLSDQGGQPVVNLATHGALPLACHLDRCRALWRRGDTVLLHLEYGYWGDAVVSDWYIDQSLIWAWTGSSRRWLDPDPIVLITHVPPGRVIAGVLASLSFDAFRQPQPSRVLVPGWGPDTHLGAMRMPVNGHGDLIQEGLPLVGSAESIDYVRAPFREDAASVQECQKFLAAARACGVTVFCAFPATIQSDLADFSDAGRKSWVDSLGRWLAAHGAGMLGRPEETQTTIEMFLDTPYHLKPEGRARHTATLLRQLRSHGWPSGVR
jgi:hypothetical protein